MKQTAVEWLIDELLDGKPLIPSMIEQAKKNGKTEEEIKEYVQWNASDMYKAGDEESGYSLWDELMEQDVIREKITGDETEVLILED